MLKGQAEDEERIKKLGKDWLRKYHVLDRFNDGHTNGFLDAAAGITLADKVDNTAIPRSFVHILIKPRLAPTPGIFA